MTRISKKKKKKKKTKKKRGRIFFGLSFSSFRIFLAANVSIRSVAYCYVATFKVVYDRSSFVFLLFFLNPQKTPQERKRKEIERTFFFPPVYGYYMLERLAEFVGLAAGGTGRREEAAGRTPRRGGILTEVVYSTRRTQRVGVGTVWFGIVSGFGEVGRYVGFE